MAPPICPMPLTDVSPYLSFLALEESCISVNGVAYPMSHRIITLKDIFSISNEITSEVCDIDIHYGRVLMMETRD